MKSSNIRYLPAVDHIRAFASILILLYHGLHLFGYRHRFGSSFTFENWAVVDNPFLAFLLEGHTAVALFMVLSGFIFTYGTLGSTPDYGRFLLNRVLRIYPMVILFLIAGLAVFPAQATLPGIAQTLLMLGNVPGAVQIPPFSSMFWAIAVEFQFYLLFPFLIRWLNERGPRHLIGLLVLMLAIRGLGVMMGVGARDLSYWTLVGRADQFLLGMVAGYVALRHPGVCRAPAAIVAGAVAVILAAWLNRLGGWPMEGAWRILMPTVEAVVWAVFVLGYLDLGRHLPGWLSLPLCRLGEISFSIYLWHFVVIEALLRFGWAPRMTGDALIDALLDTLLLALPVTLALSWLTWTLVESPFLRMRRRYVIRDAGTGGDMKRRRA